MFKKLFGLDKSSSTKILLVDDEKVKRLKVARALRAKGFEVTEKKSGLEALDILGKKKFDVLVIDNIMPNLTGIDACILLNSKKIAQKMKIILMLGFGSMEDYPEAQDCGITKAIKKPVNTENLVNTIKELVPKK